MNESVVISLAAILFFGVGSQFLAWKLKLPSILLLLLSGIALGPITGLLDPDALFGEALFPAVSFAVAIILFEGGLSLKIRELKATSVVVQRLISVGIVATWVLCTVFAKYTLDLPWMLAALLGSILTVTGPTVVLPLLMLVRPKGHVNSVLKWEGILNDPVGALLAVLVFEVVITANLGSATSVFVQGFGLTIVVGGLLGLGMGMLMTLAMRHHWVPEFLSNTFTLTAVLVLFTVSNLIQHESGLFSVTIMGIYLGNQKLVSIRNLVGFKEDLRVLLLSALFIILAARLQIADLQQIHIGSFIFLGLLILVVRPVAVALSTIGSPLTTGERVFIAAMAPRGIVAAAITSLFAVRLQAMDYPGADVLAPNMFFIIIGSILIYGLAARPLAKKLDLGDDEPQGAIILGSNTFSRAFAKTLQKDNFGVLLIDARWANIKEARMEGIPTYLGNVLSEHATDNVSYTGIGRFIALTPNLELNSLACIRFSDVFGVAETYQLGELEDKDKPQQSVPDDLSGIPLFRSNATYNYLMTRMNAGSIVKRTQLSNDFTYEQFKSQNENRDPLLLCVITEQRELLLASSKRSLQPKPGHIIITLLDAEA
ncbi:sodium:proton antiporter [Allohahella marinimesophila]|uniref:Sodium:proton antiporter n=1 Tax=Allohahella marinimesophila TaxID=1054972 RepID=A0ABP7PYF9_9GAMM